jgi:hypothetical protein
MHIQETAAAAAAATAFPILNIGKTREAERSDDF